MKKAAINSDLTGKVNAVKIASAVLIAIGLVTLFCGIMLKLFGSEQYSAAENARMPEEYIEEFFSGENGDGQNNIENYIEPEYDG